MARTIPLNGISSPRHAEILAISLGLQLALEFGFLHLVLELDAQAVVNSIYDPEENLAVDGPYLVLTNTH